ncbi:nucleotidyl transferase AbiEii/AbiGii toxin family protein [Candidatus Amesbacteria bacterium]|nr:nucleotidyl transferase AbiEii/AbiGii toxin family protein [Candidatus Amesbacteria bacterium]
MNNAKHKFQLLRLLKAAVDKPELREHLYFKGGTCAMLLGWLDRFSVDLDFDIDPKVDIQKTKSAFLDIFKKLELEIKDQSKNAVEYFLKYPAEKNERNSINLDALGTVYKANRYENYYFAELDRFIRCQTRETMFANKLVAIADRVSKGKRIAARDIYDIYYFYSQGFSYETEVIVERTGKTPSEYFGQLLVLIEQELTQTIIDEDLNYLLSLEKFKKIRLSLKEDALLVVRQEMSDIS